MEVKRLVSREGPSSVLSSTRGMAELQVVTYEPNWLLIGLPTVIAFNTVLSARLIAFTMIGVGVLSFLWRPPTQGQQVSRILLTWGSVILPALSLVIILRPNAPATVTSSASYIIALIVFLRVVLLSHSKASAFVSMIDAIGAFLIVSVALTLLGFATASTRTASLENTLTGGRRVIFALSPHLAATPGAAGIFIAAVLPILIAYRRLRFLRLMALGCAFYILIASQVRMAIAVAAAVSLCAFFLPRILRKASAWIAVLLLSFPFFFRGAQEGTIGNLGSAVAANIPGMTRVGDSGGFLTERSIIWRKSQSYHSAWADWVHQVFGYGSFGHIKSGAVFSYTTEDNFSGFADRTFITPHNSTLMVLFDSGWVGVVIFIATIAFAARSIAKGQSPVELAALSALIGLCLVGSTEFGLTPEMNLTIWWLLVGIVAIAFARDEELAPGLKLKGQREDRRRPQTVPPH